MCHKIKNMKRTVKILILLLTTIGCGCTAYRRIPYLQDSELMQRSNDAAIYMARIVANDILSIYVNTTESIASEPFNLIKPTPNAAVNSTSQYIDYIVDERGTIEFPTLGEIEVVGLSCREVESLIKSRLKPYLIDPPVVTVIMTDYKISVLGEVNSPGVKIIASSKANIFEALAMAGDLTIYGQRYNVKLVREESDGGRIIVTLDLNDANIVNSEYYYLRQNDVIYVSPNRTKGNTSAISSSTTIWISISSTFVSVVSLLLALLL